MADFEFDKKLAVKKVKEIPGIIEFDLTVLGDNRGWFKENWQREKMVELGLPDFKPVQNNFSFNNKTGATRGLHAEPWDKFVSIGSGKIFGAWVDIREGSPTFGKTYTTILDPGKAIFIPRGVANGYQTLTDNVVYTYLVNDHWSPNAEYSFVNAADPVLKIKWPIPLNDAKVEMSEKDKNHPPLKDAIKIKSKKVMITGANGQLGSELKKLYPDAVCVDRDEFDITDWSQFANYNWREFDLILNAAVYANVDGAETDEGRHAAWAVNVTAVRNLTKVANEHNITLVHVSSDYVFDGTVEIISIKWLILPIAINFFPSPLDKVDTAVYTIVEVIILETAKLFTSGGSQAVRLP
ncbi:dTDP-4-dehydrorhamnose 3,5-epimerase family protein, partial [Candidatus Saccharibacteria bacterium]|nr:dTDP-4-dehydrorhamnose 3,5-epimerase family protein [Candidatus Saccharibacteria bacterium]